MVIAVLCVCMYVSICRRDDRPRGRRWREPGGGLGGEEKQGEGRTILGDWREGVFGDLFRCWVFVVLFSSLRQSSPPSPPLTAPVPAAAEPSNLKLLRSRAAAAASVGLAVVFRANAHSPQYRIKSILLWIGGVGRVGR